MSYLYKTIFVEATFIPPKSSIYKRESRLANVEELSLMLEAAKLEKQKEGYSLFHSESIRSSRIQTGGRASNFTQGVLLTFRKPLGDA